MNTLELVEMVRARTERKTDYAVAQALGTAPNVVTRWAQGERTMADEYAVKAAEFLGIDPGPVLLSINAERSRGRVREIFQRLAATLGAAALACVLWGAVDTPTAAADSGRVHIMLIAPLLAFAALKLLARRP